MATHSTIRLAEARDAAAIAAIYAPIVESTAISFELTPPDAAEMWRRVVEFAPTHPWLVCQRDGQLAGYAYAHQFRARAAYAWAAEVSVYVHADHRRRGVARGLYTALLACLRVQGFHTAQAGITLPNPGSVALHEALGFRPVGVFHEVGFKLGRWHDTGWWELALTRAEGPPAPPQPVAAVRGTAEWAAAIEAGMAGGDLMS